MAAKRRRTQEQIDAAAAAAEAGNTLSVEELAISVAAFRQNQTDLKSMIDMMTATIDQNDKVLSDATARLQKLDDLVNAQARNLQEVQKKLTNDVAQQDAAMQEMHDTISKFVNNADQALVRQQEDAGFMAQELNGRMQLLENNMTKLLEDHQNFSRAINNSIDTNEALSSALETTRQEFLTERQTMLASFVDDMKSAGMDMQIALQKQIDETKVTAEEQVRAAMMEVSDGIRNELKETLRAGHEKLRSILIEAEKFQAFRRVAFNHKTRPLNV